MVRPMQGPNGAGMPVPMGMPQGASAQASKAPKVKRMQAYAAELECSEKETRHWMHKWCVENNGGKLAELPPILEGTGLQPTLPNIMGQAAQKFAGNLCMGVRPIQECQVEGKKQYWQKGDYVWRTYGKVFADIENAACGLYKLPGIGEMRMQKRQVVAALLAETSQEWMIAAQAALACGLTLTTVCKFESRRFRNIHIMFVNFLVLHIARLPGNKLYCLYAHELKSKCFDRRHLGP